MKVWATILSAVERGEPCALVSVASTRGSAPRDEGAHMVVTAEGYRGTIGGGTLEWRSIAAAQAMLAKGAASRITSHALGPELGQCCGGRVELLTEVYDQSGLATIRAQAAREAHGPFVWERAGCSLRFDVERRPLLLFGAGHVGRALVLALAPLPVSVTWVDPRPQAFPGAMPENVTPVAPADPLSVIAAAPVASFAFIMSHSHALDLALTDAALRHPAIAQVGLIGSATKRARFEQRLRQAGVAPDRIAALICPIGLAGIAGKEPAVIAAAVTAQILVLDAAQRLASEAEQPQAGPRDRRMAG